ncbi:hypothetical protein SLS56_010045 [Neofusicoccum ribis]|uniref:Heterokaryon incompatibility domain-containing protein n=1 Tax=Neofusicoccum ribis TaxID=45134 RepID=A0ABR3SFM1_9PEZI
MTSDLYHLYRSLESERHIRLLQIHHGAGPRWKGWTRRGPSFSLVHYSLDDAPPYEAVSYAWGHTARFEKLPMSDGNNLRITKSVFEAIPYLVDRSETGLLWLDQICIDQDDLEERGHQVALMRDVYRGASRTLIWLGLEDRETRLAVSIVEELWAQVRSTSYDFKGKGLTDELLKAFDFDE